MSRYLGLQSSHRLDASLGSSLYESFAVNMLPADGGIHTQANTIAHHVVQQVGTKIRGWVVTTTLARAARLSPCSHQCPGSILSEARYFAVMLGSPWAAKFGRSLDTKRLETSRDGISARCNKFQNNRGIGKKVFLQQNRTILIAEEEFVATSLNS